MQNIFVNVKNKIATADEVKIVCGNKDYVVCFSFDEEWGSHDYKTARFVTEDGYTDVLFEGTECPMPMLSNVSWVEIGVYAGDLRTSTPAYVPTDRSILCGDNTIHPEPPEDLYNQIMVVVNETQQNASNCEAAAKEAAESAKKAQEAAENAGGGSVEVPKKLSDLVDDTTIAPDEFKINCAEWAVNALYTESVETAEKANKDGSGNVIEQHYATKTELYSVEGWLEEWIIDNYVAQTEYVNDFNNLIVNRIAPLEEQVGDVDAALDAILAIQSALIGGNA